jgi:hypothetical protein
MFSPFHLCLLAIILAISVIAAREAEKKGYSSVLWFFAAGFTALIGLLILAFLPVVNEKSNLPEEQRKSRRKIGNLIAGVISALGLLLVLARLYARWSSRVGTAHGCTYASSRSRFAAATMFSSAAFTSGQPRVFNPQSGLTQS